MKSFRLFATLAAIALLFGCAAPTKYYWGSYERSLYSYYKQPANAEELEKSIAGLISEAEKTGARVPPGLYAELGYLMMQRAAYKEAITYYERERKAWPESKVLMDNMIRLAYNASTKETLKK